MFFRSIRFRLTLWYAITLVVILATSGVIWHMYLASNLLGRIDESLVIIAEDVATFHMGNHHAGPQENPGQGLEEFIRRHNWGEYVQIVTTDGHVASHTDNLSESRLPLSQAALHQAQQGKIFFETIRPLKPQPIRLLTYPVVQRGKLLEMIQVGERLSSMEMALRELRIILLTFSPAALIVLSFVGWFLAGRALSPVTRITNAARKINAENLSQRLPIEDTRDELSRLGETFNSMLSRLEDSFHKIKQFSADASHELRTPLTILRGETEVALRWAKTPEEFRHMLASNMEEIDRMSRIIENLLALAKSDAGEMSLEIKEFSLSDLVQELYLQSKTLGEAKEIAVSLQLTVAREIYLCGDALRLRQVFLNLISNAIKYTPAGGAINLALALKGNDAVVTIADTGIGIPADHLPHIFDRFYRIDKARNREDGGIGLGLSIVKSIIDAHSGRITVTSIPEVGSTFTVSLPLGGPSTDRTNDDPAVMSTGTDLPPPLTSVRTLIK